MSTPVTEEEEVPTLPAVFEHAANVYKVMEEEAKLVEAAEYGHVLIWEGHLTKLFSRLHLSVPYYTSVMRELKRMGCVTQKRRGGGNAPSQWLILHEPTEELFRQDNSSSGNHSTRRQTKLQMLEQQVRDQGRIIAEIQTNYDLIIDILQEREATHA
jgi:hypothetical protein